jgi:hypothetical protein
LSSKCPICDAEMTRNPLAFGAVAVDPIEVKNDKKMA